MISRITPADHIHVPWKNGGGVSTTIAGERLPGFAPGDWAGVIWQLGRTTITTPAPFSDLSGFERLQTVVGGAGLFLDSENGSIDLSVPFTVARYDGGLAITSRLASGPVEVVNLIARRDLAQISMVVLLAGETRELASGTHIALACRGPAVVTVAGARHDLADDEALRIVARTSVSVSTGTIVLAMITAAS